MPTIYDNIERDLLPALRAVMQDALAADFCVGYLNLRGWQHLAEAVEHLPGTDDGCARVLVGMQRPAEDEAREAYRAMRRDEPLDGPTTARLRRQCAEGFRRQLTFGVPTNAAEMALQVLAGHLRSGKARVKLHLRYPLHAKLYLAHRADHMAPLVGFVGSSNLTQAGLLQNGELNIDVLEQDAAQKLHEWFHQHWDDRYSYDISDELVQLIENSWAGPDLIRPYLVYLKVAYHLSQDARAGEQEYKLPRDMRGKLLAFQEAAVSLAARHLHMRGGVLLGDVVGLGKTLMATAVARILQDDTGSNTLIICPPNLCAMWQDYVDQYDLTAKVLSVGAVQAVLPELKRYTLLILDESHNLRNREGARYQAIRDYVERNGPRCLLVTATPYNMAYADLSNQLRLFVDEKSDLGVRPEQYFAEVDEGDFASDHQASPRSILAFEQSHHADDWRDLMRLYMVRRTRQFIIDNYAQYDPERLRHYVLFPDGSRSYFPVRQPRNLVFPLDESNPADQYAQLYRQEVVDTINALSLPRYGLALYLDGNACQKATTQEAKVIQDLGRAGRRLMGFCRTNLFKRLESSGHSFLLSVQRHILRNMITLHALENGLPVPIGAQDTALMDTATSDADQVAEQEILGLADGTDRSDDSPSVPCDGLDPFRQRAAEVYQTYSTELRKRFRWLPAGYFTPLLNQSLLADAQALCAVLHEAGEWDPSRDTKLAELEALLTSGHPREKVVVFTQFADTAEYLARELKQRQLPDLMAVTGSSDNPTAASKRFSPHSNNHQLREGQAELRVLIATDVLSEGQNLQDAHIVVNYDLPWAIIRLVQRAGRVDRIGQEHDTIQVYSFLPAEGVDRIIRLQSRLRLRLQQNAEVVGSDEQFFDEEYENALRDLYTEKSSALDDPGEGDVDLTSVALQIWHSASAVDQQAALDLPPMANATRAHAPSNESPEGALVYLRNAEGNDSLVRVDAEGRVVSQSLSAILREAACPPETPPLPRDERHYDWVASAVAAAASDENLAGGRLGPPRSARRRIYERLTACLRQRQRALFAGPELERAVNAIFQYPLAARARESLARQMRLGASDETLAEIVQGLYDDERLVVIEEQQETREPQIVCSIGLSAE